MIFFKFGNERNSYNRTCSMTKNFGLKTIIYSGTKYIPLQEEFILDRDENLFSELQFSYTL